MSNNNFKTFLRKFAANKTASIDPVFAALAPSIEYLAMTYALNDKELSDIRNYEEHEKDMIKNYGRGDFAAKLKAFDRSKAIIDTFNKRYNKAKSDQEKQDVIVKTYDKLRTNAISTNNKVESAKALRNNELEREKSLKNLKALAGGALGAIPGAALGYYGTGLFTKDKNLKSLLGILGSVAGAGVGGYYGSRIGMNRL